VWAANTIRAMRAPLLWAIVLALGVSGGALLGGCGSATKTVSVAGAPPASATAATGASSSSTASTPARSTPAAPTTTSRGTSQTSTRSAPEPAFTHQGSSAEGLSAAMAVLRARGFTANSAADYHSNQSLRVLVGTRTGSGDGYGQQAFFFVNGRYIGTDTSQPSAKLRVVGQGDTEVTLEYPLYRKNDPLCCPGAGVARVRFQLNNGRLSALDPIPPASSQSGVSRY
jgi:hypothetical protein